MCGWNVPSNQTGAINPHKSLSKQTLVKTFFIILEIICLFSLVFLALDKFFFFVSLIPTYFVRRPALTPRTSCVLRCLRTDHAGVERCGHLLAVGYFYSRRIHCLVYSYRWCVGNKRRSQLVPTLLPITVQCLVIWRSRAHSLGL